MVQSLASPLDYHDLLAALRQRGCAICRLAGAAARRYLDGWAYEHFTDQANRDYLASVAGFCPRHTWAIADMHTTFALSVAYRDVLRQQLKQSPVDHPSREGANHAPWWRRLLARRPTIGRAGSRVAEQNISTRWQTCPACQARTNSEERMLAVWTQRIDDHDLRAAFAASSGLCLPHFGGLRATCAESRNPHALAWIEETERECLRRAIAQLDELVRKHDYRYHDEPDGDDLRAWELAAELVAGQRDLW